MRPCKMENHPVNFDYSLHMFIYTSTHNTHTMGNNCNNYYLTENT